MKLLSAFAENFAKVSKINVNFDPNLTLIMGLTGSGKSTIGIDLLFFIFQGLAQKASKGTSPLIAERFRFIGPMGKSAKGGCKIYDEKDDVTHTITRKLLKDSAEVKIESSDGVQRGAEFLDALFSATLIDIRRFARMNPKEQAMAWGIDVSEFAKRRKALEVERLAIYQERERLKGVAETSAGAEEVEAVSLSGLLEQRKEIENFNSMVDEKAEAYQALLTRKEGAEVELTRLKHELNNADADLGDAIAEINDFEVPQERQDLTEIDEKIEGAEGINTKARAYEQSLVDQKAYEVEKERHKKKNDEISGVDSDMTEYLQKQELPFSNIAITNEGEFRLVVDGVEKIFSETYFSTGEILTLGAKIGKALADRSDVPEKDRLNVVWIPDAMLLDEKNRTKLFKYCNEHGLQVLAEIVGDKKQEGTNCILLHEMRVVEELGETGDALS